MTIQQLLRRLRVASSIRQKYSRLKFSRQSRLETAAAAVAETERIELRERGTTIVPRFLLAAEVNDLAVA